MTEPVAEGRMATLDGVRGFAVCGIFAMNVCAMGMPGYAYVSPYYYGGTSRADLIAWGLAYVLADGKLRALFTMLFGASMALIADGAEVRAARGEGPGAARTHFARMGWLLLFGMAHAWLLWFGDILVLYAVAGSIAFAAWGWRQSAVGFACLSLLAASLALDLLRWNNLAALRMVAEGSDAPRAAVEAWRHILLSASPADPAIAEQLRAYRGGWADVFAERARATMLFQTSALPAALPETLGYMLLGMLLHRAAYFTGAWPRRRYLLTIAIGYGMCLPLYAPIVRLLLTTRFDPVTLPLADAASFVLRPGMALAHASVVILLLRGRVAGRLGIRMAAAGRMALSNYLATSLLATTLFYGYGLGLYGMLSRAELYWVVLGVSAAMLGWSKPWLARFSYGPLEWLWRSLARGRWERFRQFPVATKSQYR